MKTIKLISIAIILSSFFACNEKSEAPEDTELVEIIEAPQTEVTLYDRLGGAEGISSIVDDIISKHLENPVVSEQFAYLAEDPDQMALVKQHTCDFLGAGTGGKEVYTGNDVPTIHRGMNITNAEFLSVVDDILFVLNEHKVSDQTKKDMLYILYSFKGQVIGL